MTDLYISFSKSKTALEAWDLQTSRQVLKVPGLSQTHQDLQLWNI
jgi:hypothetical protein